MAKKSEAKAKVANDPDILRLPAEIKYADQLEALQQNDADTPPSGWLLSPRSVLLYITGGKTLKAKIDGQERRCADHAKVLQR